MNVVNLQERQLNLMNQLVQLALARNRDITIGSSDPAMHYKRLREKFPSAIMVLGNNSVTVKGRLNERN